ncbi:Membrane protein, MarC family protein [Sulfitobacter noctilucae]|uniref:MarC family protein n=1 Tax=Sulfitobacter noctilucae TaxID=1342302 RepID=UPI0005672CCF|nr:MarC family protein [Sulfitobacter noctilucae]KIN61237.1 Membrane protein, MarC family protein [Sulfitobacter noctilucae]
MIDIDTAYTITAFATMLVVIDPVAIAPLFLALTQGMRPEQRRRIAVRATLTAAFVLAIFAFFGEAVLGFIGISMPAFRIAGGVLLFLTALDMLFDRRTKRREDRAHHEDDDHDPSVFPLAIPLIAGPGAIASIILLIGEKPGGEGLITILGITALTLVLMLVVLILSPRLDQMIGKTGIDVITRILGMLLAALSVQFVLDGLSAYGFGPGTG